MITNHNSLRYRAANRKRIRPEASTKSSHPRSLGVNMNCGHCNLVKFFTFNILVI